MKRKGPKKKKKLNLEEVKEKELERFSITEHELLPSRNLLMREPDGGFMARKNLSRRLSSKWRRKPKRR